MLKIEPTFSFKNHDLSDELDCVLSKTELYEIKSRMELDFISFIKSTTTTIDDFQPLNKWECEKLDPKKTVATWKNAPNTPKFIIDKTTGKRYLNESKDTVRDKCILLFLGTIPIQPILFIINSVKLFPKTLSNIALQIKEGNYKKVVKDIAKKIARVVFFPFTLLALVLAAFYGIVNPYDGRKLYASIERVGLVGPILLAPCFQPNPTSHFFGSDIEIQNVY